MTCIKNQLEPTNGGTAIGLRAKEVLEFWEPIIDYTIYPNIGICGSNYISIYEIMFQNKDINNIGGVKGSNVYANATISVDIGTDPNGVPKLAEQLEIQDPFLTIEQKDECEQSDQGCPQISRICNISNISARSVNINGSIISSDIIQDNLYTSINDSVINDTTIDSKILTTLNKSSLSDCEISSSVVYPQSYTIMINSSIFCSDFFYAANINAFIVEQEEYTDNWEFKSEIEDPNDPDQTIPVPGYAIYNCSIECPVITINNSKFSGCNFDTSEIYIKGSTINSCNLNLTTSSEKKAPTLSNYFRRYAGRVSLPPPDPDEPAQNQNYMPVGLSTYNNYTCTAPYFFDPDTNETIGCSLRFQTEPSTFREIMATLIGSIDDESQQIVPYTYNTGIPTSINVSFENSSFIQSDISYENVIHINNCSLTSSNIQPISGLLIENTIDLYSSTIDTNTIQKTQHTTTNIINIDSDSTITIETYDNEIFIENYGTLNLIQQSVIKNTLTNNGVLNLNAQTVQLENFTKNNGITNANDIICVSTFANIGQLNCKDMTTNTRNTNYGSINADNIHASSADSFINNNNITAQFFQGPFRNQGNANIDFIASNNLINLGSLTSNTISGIITSQGSITCQDLIIQDSQVNGSLECQNISGTRSNINATVKCSNIILNDNSSLNGSIEPCLVSLSGNCTNNAELMDHTVLLTKDSINKGSVTNAIFSDKSINNLGFVADSEFFSSSIIQGGTLSGNIKTLDSEIKGIILLSQNTILDIEQTFLEDPYFGDTPISFTFYQDDEELATIEAANLEDAEDILGRSYDIVEQSYGSIINITNSTAMGYKSTTKTLNLYEKAILSNVSTIISDNINIYGPNAVINGSSIFDKANINGNTILYNGEIGAADLSNLIVKLAGTTNKCSISNGIYEGNGKLIWTISDTVTNTILGTVDSALSEQEAINIARSEISAASNIPSLIANLHYSDQNSTIYNGSFTNVNLLESTLIGDINNKTVLNNCFLNNCQISTNDFIEKVTFEYNNCVLQNNNLYSENYINNSQILESLISNTRSDIRINNSSNNGQISLVGYLSLDNSDNHGPIIQVTNNDCISSTNYNLISCSYSNFINSTNQNLATIEAYQINFINSQNLGNIQAEFFNTDIIEGILPAAFALNNETIIIQGSEITAIYLYIGQPSAGNNPGFYYDNINNFVSYFDGLINSSFAHPNEYFAANSFIDTQIISPLAGRNKSQALLYDGAKIISNQYVFSQGYSQ